MGECLDWRMVNALILVVECSDRRWVSYWIRGGVNAFILVVECLD
jgi:hypothetical protein